MKVFLPHSEFASKSLSPKFQEEYSGHVILNKRAIVERAIASTNHRSSFASTTSTRLSSSNSLDSVSSLVSSSTTDSEFSQFGKRKIFPEYWQKHPQTRPPIIDQSNLGIASLVVSEPRSPLLEHYPANSDDISSKGHTSSSTSAISDLNNNKNDDLKERLLITPPRRSIFGKVENKPLPLLDQYFSKHEHMKVVSSSVDGSMEEPTTSNSTDLLRKRRLRSHSCCDATIAASKKAHQRPLHSCLKRRNSHAIGSRSSDDVTNPKETESESQRRHSVHFDSQISIIAFQEPASYESVSNTDGSWTKFFER